MTSFSNSALSRRYVLAGGAALGALPFSALAQHITANATLQTPPDQDAANIAAHTDANSHLTVEVLVNGARYRFVVDTGAERSVIADDVAAALNLPHGPTVMVDGLSRRVEAQTVKVDKLSFGPFNRKNLLVPVLPRSSLISDGYLGLDAINGSRVTFDFKAHEVKIEQPRGLYEVVNPTLESTRVEASGKAGQLKVTDCLVDSVAATAFIDTGAEVSVGNPALYEALKSRNKVLVELGALVLTGVTGGTITGPIIPVKRIRLDDLSFTNGALVIADVPDFDTWDLRNRPALLIGMDYLRQFSRVSIDYRAKEIRFELSLAPPNPTPGVEIANNA